MIRRVAALLLAAALTLAASSPVAACLWDTDTIMQERSRFPTTLELMTGKFIRHAPGLYAWRVRDRQAKIAADPEDLSLVDDLAVAHDKLGDHAAAIAAMEGILDRAPRRYETLANLGTFYIHDGQLERGVEFIDRALEVNPDAHFGRERYQRWLAEYVLGCKGESGAIVFPLFIRAPHGFEAFVADKRGVDRLSVADAQAAVQGVLGMMRFGDHRSPILLEALGDLLSAPHDHDAGRLAARAYLLAADAVGDPSARGHYEAQAEEILAFHRDGDLETVRAALADERAEADAWYAELVAREEAWIEAGDDPEAKIAELYASDPRITGELPWASTPWAEIARSWRLPIALVGLGLGGLFIARRRSRRWRG